MPLLPHAHRRYSVQHSRRRLWVWKRLETSVLVATAFTVGMAWGALVIYAAHAQWAHASWLLWFTPVVAGLAVGGAWAWTVEHSIGWEDGHGLPLVEARLVLPPTLRVVLEEWEQDDNKALLVRDLRALQRWARCLETGAAG